MSDAPYVRAAFINAITEEGTKAEAVEWLQKTWNELCQTKHKVQAKQAEIDRLMLEFCPDEMTPEQVDEWNRHQRPTK